MYVNAEPEAPWELFNVVIVLVLSFQILMPLPAAEMVPVFVSVVIVAVPSL